MINILWIEDEYSEQKQSTWFNNRKVCVKTSFDEGEKAINSCLAQFDLIVLDINLEKSGATDRVKELAMQFDIKEVIDNGKKTSPEDIFLEEAGMYLFLKLLEHGFPRKQIIFMTANADKNISLVDELRKVFEQKNREEFNRIFSEIQNGLGEEQINECKILIGDKNTTGLFEYLENYYKSLNQDQTKNTYNRFCEAYKRCRIEPPEAINKNLNEAKHSLNKWLEGHEKNTYLVLRRGIIEGCNYLKKLIKENDDNIQLRSFVRGTKKNSPVIEILTTDIENYLDTVAQFLPLRQPASINEEYRLFLRTEEYRLFLRTLVHEWEENIDPQETTERYGSDIHTYAWLSKQTRNWVSHAKLLEPLNSEIIAFLFLVNMRAMFNLPIKIQDYEYILLKCMSKPPVNIINDKTLKSYIENFECVIDEILSGYRISLNTEKGNPRAKYFSEKINDIYRHNTGNPDAEKHDYQSFLFQYFWVNQKQNTNKLTANSIDFLPTLAQHIYIRSFYMNIFPIKNYNDYKAALAEIDKLMDAETNTPEGDALNIWVTLVESYEAKQFPISAPHSINAIING